MTALLPKTQTVRCAPTAEMLLDFNTSTLGSSWNEVQALLSKLVLAIAAAAAMRAVVEHFNSALGRSAIGLQPLELSSQVGLQCVTKQRHDCGPAFCALQLPTNVLAALLLSCRISMLWSSTSRTCCHQPPPTYSTRCMTLTEKVQTLYVGTPSAYGKVYLQQSVMACGSTYLTMMHPLRYGA